MSRETALAAGAVGLAAVALLAAVVVPGALADPSEHERPGRVDVADMPIAPGRVTGETVTLAVEARLRHAGPPTENVTVLFRAVDAQSGLVATERRVDVGTLEREREVPVRANLTVEREGGYRVEVVVYRDGRRVDQGSRTVQGLEALVPPRARTPVRFTEADALPALSFSVVEAGPNRTTLEVSASLTNAGDAAPDDLSVRFVLRQAESNIVAAERQVDVGSIRPGRTASVSARVTVPSGYNYYVDAVLFRNGVLVDSARAAANLDPARTISVNETREEVDLQVSDFEAGDGEPRETGTPAPAGTQGPGFGVGAAAAALVGAALLARRWSA